MPTKKQLHQRMMHDFLYGRDVYADRPNIRGSAYVGRTRGYLDIKREDEEIKERAAARWPKNDRPMDDDIYD